MVDSQIDIDGKEVPTSLLSNDQDPAEPTLQISINFEYNGPEYVFESLADVLGWEDWPEGEPYTAAKLLEFIKMSESKDSFIRDIGIDYDDFSIDFSMVATDAAGKETGTHVYWK